MSAEHHSNPIPDDLFLGDLLPEEKETILNLKQSYNECLLKVGEAYLRLNALAQRAVDTDQEARGVLNSVLSRLGAPPDTLVQIHVDEGKIFRIPSR